MVKVAPRETALARDGRRPKRSVVIAMVACLTAVLATRERKYLEILLRGRKLITVLV
jgi:hypothetical protein